MTLKHWKKYLSILGIILFVYILFKLDFFTIVTEIRNAHLSFLLIAALCLIVMLIVQTFKWYLIARMQGITVPFRDAFEINIISNFYGFVTPSKAGGIIRAEYLKYYTVDKNIGQGLFNFTIDKILDFIAIIFMTIVFSFIFKDVLAIPVVLFSSILVFFILATLFFLSKERSKFVLLFFYRRLIPSKFRDTAKVTFDSFYENVPKKRYFFLFFFLTLCAWTLIYGIFYYIGLSLDIPLPFYYYLAILPIGTIVGMLPISISGLGTREATLISLFALFNVPAAKVFSMSLINIFLVGILPALCGIYYILKRKNT